MLHLYNSLTKCKEPFKSLRDREAKVYVCGPTVYHNQHIGGYRTYIIWDLLVRTLRFLDYKTTHVMNITDVGHLTDDDLLSSDSGEDKMEKAAKRENKTVWDIAKYYEEDFFQGCEWLHIKRPDHVTRATEHIEEMIAMVETLVDRGIGYVTPSGVYFDISKFPAYGELSGNTLEQLAEGASGRVEQIGDKKSPHDFALWVLGKEQSMMWDSPWGRGYPGWHIECSAMSRAKLGEHIDIHGGGMDNKFPHHECEIAQSECSFGVNKKRLPFSKYWMHTGLITVEGEKMSKSKGNFYTLHDTKEQGIHPREFRMLALSSHYRSGMDYSETVFHQVRKNLETIGRFVERLEQVSGFGEQGLGPRPQVLGQEEQISMEFSRELNTKLGGFVEALEDDLNTPELFAQVFEMIREFNGRMDAEELNGAEAEALLGMLRTVDSVLEVMFPWEEQAEAPEGVRALAQERLEAKEAKDWEKADSLRAQVEEMGWEIEDGKGDFRLRRK